MIAGGVGGVAIISLYVPENPFSRTEKGGMGGGRK